MIQFSDFYDDMDFMIALYFNGMLDNADIYEIINRLNNKTSNDVLAKIIANGSGNYNNKRLFKNYLNALGIKISDHKRDLIAKVFYYILYDRIDFFKGIKFTAREVSVYENIKKYVGDDVGIEQILGNFYLIDDGDIMDEKGIETLIELIITEMKQYIHDHLEKFYTDNNKSLDNKKIVIETEIEKKVKVKALAKGIQIKDRCVEKHKIYYNEINVNLYEDVNKLIIEHEWINESSEHKPEWKYLFKEGNEFVYYYKKKMENEYELIDGKWSIIFKDGHTFINLVFSNYNHMNRDCLLFRMERIYGIVYDSFLYYQHNETILNESRNLPLENGRFSDIRIVLDTLKSIVEYG